MLNSAPWYRRMAVHPRARGEHSTVFVACSLHFGSSPRTRGTCNIGHLDSIINRFIPAHAGNMSPCQFATLKNSVHPRARGEHSRDSANAIGSHGSSPRTRGTYRAPWAELSWTRFIPAHAGNMRRCRLVYRHATVHPRARGEHCLCFCLAQVEHGSSPRTRGT